MDITIRHITNERKLDAALALEAEVFGHLSEDNSPAYARARWVERMERHGALMLYAEAGGAVVGIVFGRVEDGGVTVGPVAVAAERRGQGVGRALMLALEERARAQGVGLLTLGSVESAEGFYAGLGYTGSLLIQSERHGVDELLALNPGYPERFTNVYGGAVHKLCLELPAPDRVLQRRYERELPGCRTQMLFQKWI